MHKIHIFSVKTNDDFFALLFWRKFSGSWKNNLFFMMCVCIEFWIANYVLFTFTKIVLWYSTILCTKNCKLQFLDCLLFVPCLLSLIPFQNLLQKRAKLDKMFVVLNFTKIQFVVTNQQSLDVWILLQRNTCFLLRMLLQFPFYFKNQELLNVFFQQIFVCIIFESFIYFHFLLLRNK